MTDHSVGEAFVRAIAAKDRDALLTVLSPDIDFRAMTPSRFWEANSAATLIDDVILGKWFDDGDRVDGVDSIAHERVVDRERVGYRFRVTTPDGPFVVEQQAYFSVDHGRIDWLRVMCSGFRPVAAETA